MAVTLLLIEDDTAQSEAVKTLFEESMPDTTVEIAATLAKALTYDRSRIDAILLDLGLPDSSGLQTLTAVLDHFAPVPVVVLTATADTEVAEQALALGAEDYLTKGIIAAATIRRVVRYAIRRHAARMAAAERDTQNAGIAKLGQLALTDISTTALLNTTCEVVSHVLGGAHIVFMELSADGVLRAKVTIGCAASQWPPISLDQDCPLAEAIRTNQFVKIDDIRERNGSSAATILRELQAVSAVAVPVRTTFTAPEGALVVWRKEPRGFNDQEISFLTAISNTFAAAAQRNATQEALRLSREELQRILDGVPDRILRFGDDLRVQYGNLATARGASLVTKGMHVDELPIPTAQRARWKSALERALASGVAERFDLAVLNPPLRFEVSVVPLLHGERRSAVVVLHDITERVRAQARYEALFASNMVGVFFWGSDGTITQANRAFLDMVGRPPSEVADRHLTIAEVMASTTQALHAERLRELRARGMLPPHHAELVHESGARIPVLLASAVIDPVTEESVTFALDETAIRRAEDEVRSQLMLLDNARDAIILRDIDGRISYWNEGARRLYGWTRDEAVGRVMSDLVSVAGDDGGLTVQAAVLTCGEWQGELHQRTQKGTPIVVDSRCSLIPSTTGEEPRLLIINTDITERKSFEQQLLHAQRLESLGTLAGGIAHDLNNILMPVLIGVDHLRRLGAPAAGEPTLDRIATSARRGAELISQLLTFARGRRADNELTNPARLVAEVERMLRETISPAIEITTHVAADVWSVACDATQVLQVLLNLAVNARDAMPHGGNLTIRAENVELDAQYAKSHSGISPGAYVMLSVADTGTGILPEAIGKIFDPFFTTKSPGSGTGLGLATARSIVKNHGGFINVYSEPGSTMFKVYLPALYEKEVEDPEEVPTPVVSGSGELILVIDDEMAIRDVTAATLQSFGYRVLTASDGSEGIALYSQNPDVAVVVTDMFMPVLDGPTTIRALRKLNPNIRVIGITGYRRQGVQGPAPDVLLQKPFRAPDLLNAIRFVLSPALDQPLH